MSKLLKAIYTFSQKQTDIPGRSSHEKSMVVNTEVPSGSCVKYSILGDS